MTRMLFIRLIFIPAQQKNLGRIKAAKHNKSKDAGNRSFLKEMAQPDDFPMNLIVCQCYPQALNEFK